LTLTSNTTAADFQYLESGGRALYFHVTEKANQWNENKNCGLVVGATKPQELLSIRKIAPDLTFLIPGIGAQGGDLEKVVLHGRDGNGTGILINVGRDILYAGNSKNFATEARARAEYYISEMQKLHRE